MREFLERLARRARVVAAREGFLDAFFWSSYAAASLLVADRIRLEFEPGARPYSDARGAAIAIGTAVAISLAVAIVRASRTRPAAADLARAADRSLGLSDRVATAVEDAPGAFAPLVARQAEESIAGAAPGRVFPAPPAGARRWSIAAVLAAILIVLFPIPQAGRAASDRSIRERRPRSGAADDGDEQSGGATAAAGGAAATRSGGNEGGGSSGKRPGRGRPAPPPPLFGDPDRTKLHERPEHVDPLLGEGAYKPSGGLGVDPSAAAAGAPGAASDPERLAAYRRQAEAFVGRDGFPETDRSIVRGYFERVAPGK